MADFTLLGFAERLAKIAATEHLVIHHGLEKSAKLVEHEAKAEIGHYQDAAGPFAAWPELADSTKQDRVNKGFTENDPLLRTGDMRDSIHHEVNGDVAHVGSNDDKAVWQELGTNRIPPRSFLGGAAFRKEKEVHEIFGEEAVAWLSGKHL